MNNHRVQQVPNEQAQIYKNCSERALLEELNANPTQMKSLRETSHYQDR